ncbi:hypothetical protein HDU98_008796 [Podochytrium sp. JEL0797]|nr:hypothetical protein HDU98_008796 [Podochytrium sp. JEL0797]
MPSFLLSATLWATAIAVAAVTNLIQNPNFDSYATRCGYEESECHIYVKPVTDADLAFWGNLSQTVSIPTGKNTVRLSFDINCHISSAAACSVQVGDSPPIALVNSGGSSFATQKVGPFPASGGTPMTITFSCPQPDFAYRLTNVGLTSSCTPKPLTPQDTVRQLNQFTSILANSPSCVSNCFKSLGFLFPSTHFLADLCKDFERLVACVNAKCQAGVSAKKRGSTATSVSVRDFERAVAVHWSVLSELAKETFVATFPNLYSATDLQTHLDTTYTQEIITKEIETELTYLVVDDTDPEGKAPWGFCQLRPNTRTHLLPVDEYEDPCWELHRIYLSKHKHGTGAGSTLMKFAMQKMHEAGVKCVWLSVWSENDQARKFYEKWGFKLSIHPGFSGKSIEYVVGDQVDLDCLYVAKL